MSVSKNIPALLRPAQASQPSTTDAISDEVIELAANLAKTLDKIFSHPQYETVFISALVHGCPYTGPHCGEELEALKTALKKIGRLNEERVFDGEAGPACVYVPEQMAWDFDDN